MDAVESRVDVRTEPIFVDASGRRRRGVSVLGYLGASACTAYLAAFGITLGTNANTIDAAGVALEPSPVSDEDTGDAPDELPGDTVVASSPAPSATIVEAVATTPAAAASHTPAHVGAPRQPATSGRHAKAEPATGAVHRVLGPPRVAVRVVHRARHAATETTPPRAHHANHPSRGGGTHHVTPDPTPTTGTGSGGSSSGGAGPTTGTGGGPSTGGTGGTGGTGASGSTGTAGGTGSETSHGTGTGATSTGGTTTGTDDTSTTTSTGGTTTDPITTDILDTDSTSPSGV